MSKVSASRVGQVHTTVLGTMRLLQVHSVPSNNGFLHQELDLGLSCNIDGHGCQSHIETGTFSRGQGEVLIQPEREKVVRQVVKHRP